MSEVVKDRGLRPRKHLIRSQLLQLVGGRCSPGSISSDQRPELARPVSPQGWCPRMGKRSSGRVRRKQTDALAQCGVHRDSNLRLHVRQDVGV